jgi:cation transport regulator ChaB
VTTTKRAKEAPVPTSKEDLPGTIKRSPAKAQRTYAKTLDSAHEQYEGDEARAHRVAFAALKHSFRKVGDHWEPKSKKGPSDPQAAKSGAAARKSKTPTGGGKDVGASKKDLMEEARKLDVPGRSKMSRDELVRAVAKAKR